MALMGSASWVTANSAVAQTPGVSQLSTSQQDACTQHPHTPRKLARWWAGCRQLPPPQRPALAPLAAAPQTGGRGWLPQASCWPRRCRRRRSVRRCSPCWCRCPPAQYCRWPRPQQRLPHRWVHRRQRPPAAPRWVLRALQAPRFPPPGCCRRSSPLPHRLHPPQPQWQQEQRGPRPRLPLRGLARLRLPQHCWAATFQWHARRPRSPAPGTWRGCGWRRQQTGWRCGWAQAPPWCCTRCWGSPGCLRPRSAGPQTRGSPRWERQVAAQQRRRERRWCLEGRLTGGSTPLRPAPSSVCGAGGGAARGGGAAHLVALQRAGNEAVAPLLMAQQSGCTK